MSVKGALAKVNYVKSFITYILHYAHRYFIKIYVIIVIYVGSTTNEMFFGKLKQNVKMCQLYNTHIHVYESGGGVSAYQN